MKTTTQRSGVRGQALVMVTMGLIAMCGLMGLAVDLGWSYFVEKQAQTAADAAALAAVQEANVRIGGTSTAGFMCPVSPSGATVYCQDPPLDCASIGADSNLWNGCLYAQQNGFTQGGLGGRQTVRMEAYDGTVLPSTAPGIVSPNVSYWVTVRTTQTVPQLFSAVLGNTEGLVSARATAALARSIVPGSFWGLNQAGDCINTRSGGETGFTRLCGVDVDANGRGSRDCPGTSSRATVCAGSGIVLSSTCHGVAQLGCTGGGGGAPANSWAGQTQGGASVWSGTAQVQTGGAVDDPSAWSPPPVSTATATTDPYLNRPQPPLQVPSGGGAIGTCAVTGGVINDSTGPVGPFQYFAVDGAGAPTGAPLVVSGNVQFTGTGTCPGTLVAGASQNDANFPVYTFYGGLHIEDSVNFGPGQYVMAGTSSTSGSTFQLPAGSGTKNIVGDTGAGTQFITTDLGYPGLDSQYTALPAALQPGGSIRLYQGNIALKSGNSTNVTLDGIDVNNGSVPAALEDYNGSLFWQDRRNSTLISDSTGHVLAGAAGGPCNVAMGGSTCSTVPGVLDANGVTDTSPGIVYEASTPMALSGSLYQARGAWFSFQGGPDISSGLQIVTGMVTVQGGGQVALLPNPLPIIRYVVALIH